MKTVARWLTSAFLAIAFVSMFPSMTMSLWAADQPDTAKLAFEKLRSLAGQWNGSFQWTGARTDSGKMNVNYYLTGNGSALVENLSTEAVPSMTTVYHLDGSDLRATHFCGAQNQPRLKADRIDLTRGVINFAFVDATNLRSADAPHVTGLELEMGGPNQLTISFTFEAAGKRSLEHISLTRGETAQK